MPNKVSVITLIIKKKTYIPWRYQFILFTTRYYKNYEV